MIGNSFDVIHQCIEQRTTSSHWRRMHHHRWRLIDDDNIIVFENNIERNIFRTYRTELWLWNKDFNNIATFDLVSRLRFDPIVDKDRAGIDRFSYFGT